MNIDKAIRQLATEQDNTMSYNYENYITNADDFNNINVDGDKSFTFTWADVQARATELDALPSREDLKASAKAKLIAGEALTEDEADTVVL